MKEQIELPTHKLINEYLSQVKECHDSPRKYVIKPDKYKTLNLAAVKNSDKSLRKLLKKFPKNNNLPEIYLKVVAINSFYSTNILDTYRLAYHISNIENFDEQLKNGELALIDLISTGHGIANDGENGLISDKKEKRLYSFATKYCSWHTLDNPNVYPIIDSYIEKLLMIYLKMIYIQKGEKTPYNARQFRDYKIFKMAIEEFQEYYEGKYNLKEIDKFLWIHAKTLELKDENVE